MRVIKQGRFAEGTFRSPESKKSGSLSFHDPRCRTLTKHFLVDLTSALQFDDHQSLISFTSLRAPHVRQLLRSEVGEWPGKTDRSRKGHRGYLPSTCSPKPSKLHAATKDPLHRRLRLIFQLHHRLTASRAVCHCHIHPHRRPTLRPQRRSILQIPRWILCRRRRSRTWPSFECRRRRVDRKVVEFA